MELTQDDLRFLRHFRDALSGDEARLRESQRLLSEDPGRALGRNAACAFVRATDLLARAARRPLSFATGLSPSADERRVIAVARALADRREGEAEAAARWLVRGDASARLLAMLRPAVAAIYLSQIVRRAA